MSRGRAQRRARFFSFRLTRPTP